MAAQPPLAKRPFPRIRGGDPVIHGTGNDPNCVSRLSLLPDRNQKFSAHALFGVGESFDLIQSSLVEMNVLPQSCHVPRLFPDDFGCCVFDNSGAVLVWSVGCAHEIFRGLADSPYAGVPLSSSAEELHDSSGKNRRLEKSPALIEQDDA